jgi:hypothetical protein
MPLLAREPSRPDDDHGRAEAVRVHLRHGLGHDLRHGVVIARRNAVLYPDELLPFLDSCDNLTRARHNQTANATAPRRVEHMVQPDHVAGQELGEEVGVVGNGGEVDDGVRALDCAPHEAAVGKRAEVGVGELGHRVAVEPSDEVPA